MGDRTHDATHDPRGRYARLIRAALPRVGAFAPEAEGPAVLQVERGLAFPLLLADPRAVALAESLLARLAELAPAPGAAAPDVVDRRGHRRPAYRGLLVYTWLQAFRIASHAPDGRDAAAPAWQPEALAAWCRGLEPDAARLTTSPAGIPAPAGARAAAACWAGLALHLAGTLPGHGERAGRGRDVFTRLAAAQQPSGALLSAGPADNPETLWYHELVILHAAATFAAITADPAVGEAVRRAAAYQMDEIQPDHATGQPWALFAFARDERTRPLADQMLHAAAVQAAGGGGPGDGVASILLADALYCLSHAT